MTIKGNRMTLNEIIKFMVKTRCEDDNFCIYVTDEKLFWDKECLASSYPQVDESDNEVYPPDAASKGL